MVNRVADKESAKSILKHNGNQAAMIGMEILYTIISTLTVTSMMAAFSAAAVRIYGTTLVSLVVSFINDLSRVSRWGYYSPSMIFSPFKFILMALIFVLLVAATGIEHLDRKRCSRHRSKLRGIAIICICVKMEHGQVPAAFLKALISLCSLQSLLEHEKLSFSGFLL